MCWCNNGREIDGDGREDDALVRQWKSGLPCGLKMAATATATATNTTTSHLRIHSNITI